MQDPEAKEDILREILTPQVKREVRETNMQLQDAKGSYHEASKVLVIPHDPPSAEEVDQSHRRTLGFEPSI